MKHSVAYEVHAENDAKDIHQYPTVLIEGAPAVREHFRRKVLPLP